MKSVTALFFSVLISLLGIAQPRTVHKSIVPDELRPVDSQPNFILIVADDLGYGDLGYNGSTQIKTPNIDFLAKSGIQFEQGYVSSPVCSPSRAGLLTGINQVEFGFDNNLAENQPGFDIEYLGLPLTQKTIADHLRELGYINGLIGKWHLGNLPRFHPLKRGFDEFWGYTGGGHDYFSSTPNGKGYQVPIESNYKTPQDITYLTDDKGDECVDFINRHRGKPFFLFASFNAPHTPMQALPEDLALYDHISDSKRRTYAAMVHRLDVNVGKIMDAIERNGIAENTMIIFLSDNGGPVNSNASLNAPLNGQKGILLEGGIHVPFLMKWQGKLPEKKILKHPVSSLDIVPTLVSLAGGTIDNEGSSGINLAPYILGESNSAPHQELKWKFTISASIRCGDWKLIRLPDRLPLLFHLPTDGSEQINVSLQNIDITKELLQRLGSWDVELPHPVFLEGAVWKKRQLDLYDKKYSITQPASD